MQCFSWETSEKFERIKIRKFIIKKFVCSINRNMFDGASVKDQKSKHFYNRKIWSFAENWRRKKYEEKCLRGIWCKDEYDFHMDCKQKKYLKHMNPFRRPRVNEAPDELLLPGSKMHTRTIFQSTELSSKRKPWA